MKGLKVMWESRAKSGLTIGLLAGGLWALAIPMAVDDYWLRILTTSVIYVVVAAGVGLLFSRLGIVSLNQIALMGVGGWIFLRLSYWLDAVPGMLIMCLAGLATMGIGVLIGLPSLRLSGLSLAVVTLMFAAFAEIVFTSIGFPTGNNGWRGEPAPGETSVPIPSPAFAESNTGLWFYVVITTTVMLLLLWVFLTGRWGRAWAAIKQSEPGAVSIGIHVTSSKVTALAVVSFTTGVSGALLAVPTGSLVSQSFSAISSVILFAVVLIGGAFSLVGAVLAGLLFVALPPALEALVARIPVVLELLGPTFTNLIYVAFGIGLIQSLIASPRGIAGDLAGVGVRLRRAQRWPLDPSDAVFAFIVLVVPPLSLALLDLSLAVYVVAAIWISLWLVHPLRTLWPSRSPRGIALIGIAVGLLIGALGFLAGPWICLLAALLVVVSVNFLRKRLARRLVKMDEELASEGIHAQL